VLGGAVLRLFIIAAFVVGVDQLSKCIVAALMEAGQSIPVINNLLYITYVRNPGAAFGMLPYRTVFLIVVTLVVVVFIIYYYRTLPAGFTLLRLGLALQMGGAIGNLIDRVRSTYVVDFIDISFFPPVFNVADSAIVVGIILFLFAFWRMSPSLDGKP
jgi:signal peptidase II